MSSLLFQSARTDAGRGYGSITGSPTHAPERGVVPAAVERLFEEYVHDSQAGFIVFGTIQKDLSRTDYYGIREVRLPKA